MTECLEKAKVLDYLIKRAEEVQADFDENGGESGIYAECLEDVIQDITNIPAAEIEVIHKPTESEFKRMAVQKGYVQVAPARWLDGRCTSCGWEEPDEVEYDYETEPWEETPFCPMCGARMGGGDSNA